MVLSETILARLLQVFRREGIERYTEEELAQQVGVQKHDLEELFADKADMVRKVVAYDFKEQEKQDELLLQKAANPVEEIILLLQNGIQELKTVNPAYIADLQQHYPEVWQLCLERLGTYNYHLNLNVINKGILQGYFRKDINLQLVVKIILEQFNMLINPTIFPPERYELGEVFRSVYLYYVRGHLHGAGR